MTRSLNPAPEDAFDRAAKKALRDAPLPAAPDWLDAQITAAARTQAGIYTAQAKPRAQPWWQAPWLRVALPALAVTSVLIAVWLPQTQVTPSAIHLPAGVQLNEPARPASPAEPAAQLATPPAAAAEQKRDVAPLAPTPPPAPAAKAAQAPRSNATQTPKSSPTPRPASPPASVERESAAASTSELAGAAAASVPAVTASTSAANAAAPSRDESAAPAQAEPAAPANTPGSKFMARTHSAQTESARATASIHADVTRARGAQAPADQATPAEVQSAQAKELEAIRALLREGQRDAAAKRLATLIERTPAFQIPEDLRFLLAKP
jgi:hypothetical protein